MKRVRLKNLLIFFLSFFQNYHPSVNTHQNCITVLLIPCLLFSRLLLPLVFMVDFNFKILRCSIFQINCFFISKDLDYNVNVTTRIPKIANSFFYFLCNYPPLTPTNLSTNSGTGMQNQNGPTNPDIVLVGVQSNQFTCYQ